MLVLSRKASERIQIGDNITLQVRRIAGNRVTIAIDAPRQVRILRGELQQAAAAFQPPASEDDPAAGKQGGAGGGPRLTLHSPGSESDPDTPAVESHRPEDAVAFGAG